MKLRLLILLISSVSVAQTNFHVQYKKLLKSDLDESANSLLNLDNVDPILYDLYIIGNESFFFENKVLPPEGEESNYRLRKALSDEGLVLAYQDLKEKKAVRQLERKGSFYLVEESFDSLKWEITGIEKLFDKYIAYEAKSEINIIGRNLEPAKQIITAYFILDIPFSVGPLQFGGLPGLIVELHSNKDVMQAISIIPNPSSIPSLDVPIKGEKLNSQYEFQKTISQQRRKEISN